LVGANLHLKQALHDAKQSFQHLGQRKVGFDFLLAERIARLLELFAQEGPVPRLRIAQLELFGSKGAQVGQIAFGKGAGALRQITQEFNHLRGRIGHLGHQRQRAEVRMTQQARFVQAQGQQLVDDGAIVKSVQ